MATIAALEDGDDRSFQVSVAGPAALLTAKAIKIGERLAQIDRQPDRLKQKDALDAFRILQAIDTHVLAEGFRSHRTDVHAAAISAEALNLYREHGSSPQGRPGSPGPGGSRR